MVEHSSDIAKLMSKVTEPKKTKVISFDITAHNTLSKLGIEHEKVESYIDINDQDLIDKLFVDKSHEWYKLEGVSDLLQLDNINLGWLLEFEIASYFLSIMRNFVGMMRIIDKENPSVVLASDLLASMVKIVTKNKKIVVHSYIATNTPSLWFDRVEIPFRIGKKSFAIWISRDLALKIKNIMESVTNLIFNFKFNFSHASNKASILLLDFNPMLHGDLLKELSRLDKNVVLLNERRPAVWNLQSLKNIKQSKSKVIRLKDFLNSKLQSIILQKQKELQINLQKMSLNSKLEELFSIEGYSFWPSIKESFVGMCSRRFNEAIERFELSKELFTKMSVTCILILYAVAPEEKVILHAARGFKIPGIILQHGLIPESIHMQRIAILLPAIPPIGIKHASWGKVIANQLRQLGVKDDDIILAGSTRHDEFFRMKNKCQNKGNILFACTIFAELSCYGLDTNAFLQFENILREVCRISTNIQNKKLIIKLHPSQFDLYDVKPIIHDIDPSIPIYKTNNILDLIKDCDVLFSIGPSTVLLEAMILDKPTITFRMGSQWFYEDKIFQSEASLLVKTPEEFENALNNVLFNDAFRNELIQKGKKFVNEYLVNQGNSSNFLANIIKNY